MDVFWNLLLGSLVALAIPLLVPVREGASRTLVALGITGACLATILAHALGVAGPASQVLSVLGALLLPVVVGLMAKRLA